MNMICVIAFIVIAFFSSGCASTKYAWNNYDGVLYKHYKNPHDNEEFIEHLNEIIQEGEASGKIPPGIYAEYGYAMYERGQYDEAIKFYQKEYDKWPESRTFMTKMIATAKNQNKIRSQKTLTDNSTL